MPKAKTEVADETKPKRGSGAWLREQLKMKKNENVSDDDLAAQAREIFGGNTSKSDVAWNRNKLKKTGELPEWQMGRGGRGKKDGETKAPAKKAAAKKGKKAEAAA